MGNPISSTAAELVFFTALVLGSERATAVEPLGDLTGPWQLFVDDYVVAAKNDVERVYHPLDKYSGNPVLVADEAWEGTNVYVYGTVLPDESGTGYRIWYHSLPNDDDNNRLLYATSADGINWLKPDLGIVDCGGSTDNNIFIRRGPRDHIPSIMHTPWEPDPARQYLMINREPTGFYGAWSDDGIHYTDVPGNPVFTDASDVGQFVWDPHTEQFLGYVKQARYVRNLRRRAVTLTTATDVTSWSTPRLVLAPDDFDDRWATGDQRTHFYGLSGFAYESMYLGFLWILRATDGYIAGTIYVELVSSHDGIHWLREQGDRPPLLPLGTAGAWDDGMLFTTNYPLVEGDTIKVYYGGSDGDHGGKVRDWTTSIGLATLRKDGFASLDAGGTTGEVLTKRLVGTAGPLHVNYDATGGWLKIEVLDEEGGMVPGFGEADCDVLQGNGVDHLVTWGSQTELPAGVNPLRLRFIMQHASLYSFMAGGSVQVVEEPAGPCLAALYTFETTASDKLREDGAQVLLFHNDVTVDTDPSHAAFGNASVHFGPVGSVPNTLEIEGTSELGTHFTLAAVVNDLDNDHTRLFSSHDGFDDGSPIAVKTSQLVFDFNLSDFDYERDCDPDPDPPDFTNPNRKDCVGGLRLVCKGIAVESEPLTFTDDQYHHLAVTYDDGEVTLYFDGTEVGRDYVPGGEPVSMTRNLLVGEDANPGQDEQLVGNLDDLLVLGRTLSGAEVLALSQSGAEAFFGIVEVPGDLNDDGQVDDADCVVVRDAVGTVAGDPGFVAAADYDHDQAVTCDDVDAWLGLYRDFVQDPGAADPCDLGDDTDGDGVRDMCDLCPNTIPNVAVDGFGCPPLISGDLDRDGDVDMEDFAHFQVCLSGSRSTQADPDCADALLDADSDVDRNDLTIFLQCLSGADVPADPNCMN